MVKRKLIYLGHPKNNVGNLEIFRPDTKPTRQSHGHLFFNIMGPFRTVRCAKFMRDGGHNDPRVCCIDDAERIAKVQMVM